MIPDGFREITNDTKDKLIQVLTNSLFNLRDNVEWSHESALASQFNAALETIVFIVRNTHSSPKSKRDLVLETANILVLKLEVDKIESHLEYITMGNEYIH